MNGTQVLVRVGDGPFQPVSGWREIVGLKKGESAFDVWYWRFKGDAGQAILGAASVTGDSVDVRLRFPMGDVLDMTASVKVSPSIKGDDVLKATFALTSVPEPVDARDEIDRDLFRRAAAMRANP